MFQMKFCALFSVLMAGGSSASRIGKRGVAGDFGFSSYGGGFNFVPQDLPSFSSSPSGPWVPQPAPFFIKTLPSASILKPVPFLVTNKYRYSHLDNLYLYSNFLFKLIFTFADPKPSALLPTISQPSGDRNGRGRSQRSFLERPAGSTARAGRERSSS